MRARDSIGVAKFHLQNRIRREESIAEIDAEIRNSPVTRSQTRFGGKCDFSDQSCDL
jgi:hypothetical protein